MEKVDLSNFLELTNVGTIMLPIGEHKFELSQQAAENIVFALQGALRLLTPLAPDAAKAEPFFEPELPEEYIESVIYHQKRRAGKA